MANTFKSYTAAKRHRGGLGKFLYTEIKKLVEAEPVIVPRIWVSDVQTGTGAEQTIAHTLTVKPDKVIVVPTLIDGTDGFSVTEGTHGTANIKVTVTEDAKFKIIAIK